MNSKSETIKSEIKRMGERQEWWHDIEMTDGIKTIGRKTADLKENHDEVKWNNFSSLLSFERKNIIDLGCNEGFYEVELSKQGANKIIGVDVDDNRINKANFVKETLSLDAVEFIKSDVYKIKDLIHEKFDIVMCLGLLHRVSDPYRLITLLSELGHTCIIEWPAFESHEPMARYWGAAYKEDYYNTGYWQLSRSAVNKILERNGIPYHIDVSPFRKRSLIIASSDHDIISKVENNIDKPKLEYKIAYKYKEFKRVVRSLLNLLFIWK